MLTPKPCAVCGTIFQARTTRTVYCSEFCRKTGGNHRWYQNALAKGLCVNCRKPNDEPQHALCPVCRAGSRERYLKRKPDPKPFPCVICGTLFTRNSSNAKYCSEECRKHTPNGLCPRCKERPSEGGGKMCAPCREQRAQWWHSRSEKSKEIALSNARAWRERNPDYYRGQSGMNGRSNFKAKMRVFEHYGMTCACCGEDHMAFLTIDHVHGKGNQHRRELFGHQSGGGMRFYRWLIRQGFPDGYRTLCYNCNIGAAKHGGICPHQLDKVDA